MLSRGGGNSAETFTEQGVEVGDLLDDYPASSWDEMFDAAGPPRAPYADLHDALQSLSAEDFVRRCATPLPNAAAR